MALLTFSALSFDRSSENIGIPLFDLLAYLLTNLQPCPVCCIYEVYCDTDWVNTQCTCCSLGGALLLCLSPVPATSLPDELFSITSGKDVSVGKTDDKTDDADFSTYTRQTMK